MMFKQRNDWHFASSVTGLSVTDTRLLQLVWIDFIYFLNLKKKKTQVELSVQYCLLKGKSLLDKILRLAKSFG